MKWFLAGMAILTALMWAGAEWTKPSKVDAEGRLILAWSTDANPARREQIAPFERMNPDLRILVEPNTFDRTIVQCSTGVGPELIEIYSTDDMVAYAEAGILMDLTPYAEEMGFGPSATYERLAGGMIYNGKQYRFPANVSSNVLIYNKRMFDEAGIPYPEDEMLWEDFVELMRPLTVRTADGRSYRQFALAMGKHNVRDIRLQFGATIFNETGTRCVLDSPESIAAMEFYQRLMFEDEILPTPDSAEALSAAGGWGFGEIRWFAAEKAATIWGARWMLVIFRQYPELREHLGVALLPGMPDDGPTSYGDFRGPGINANSPHRMEALRFLQYLASEEYAEIIAMSSDGLPPLAEYTEDHTRLINPNFPWETYQEKFIRATDNTAPPEVSPFINPLVVARVWEDTLDMIQNRMATPEQALRMATDRINDGIRQALRDQPGLQEAYDEALARQREIDAGRAN